MVTPPTTPVLLDTNVISESSKPRPQPQVMAYLESLDLMQTYLSAVSVAEIERGIALLQGRDPVRAQRLRHWLETFVLPQFEGRVLPFDLMVAREWDRIMGTDAARRQSPPLLNSQLAATALVHRLTLITRNTSDFLGLPVVVYNPWPAPPTP